MDAARTGGELVGQLTPEALASGLAPSRFAALAPRARSESVRDPRSRNVICAEVYSPEAHGCIGLISSGTSSEESAFLDASAAGPGGQEAEDVFFITSSRLVSQDTDSAYDVYDAHICSTAVPCPTSAPVSPPPCTAESCRAAPTPEPGVFAAPPSSTLTGNGNTTTSPLSPPSPQPLTTAQKLSKALEACKKKPKGKRHTCETQARRTYDNKNSKT